MYGNDIVALEVDGFPGSLGDAEELVSGVVTCDGHGQYAVDINLGILIVEEAQTQVLKILGSHARKFE